MRKCANKSSLPLGRFVARGKREIASRPLDDIAGAAAATMLSQSQAFEPNVLMIEAACDEHGIDAGGKSATALARSRAGKAPAGRYGRGLGVLPAAPSVEE